MKKYLQILRSEQVHFLRAPYKIVSFVLFLIAIIYGAQNGHDLFKKHQNEIASIRSKNEELVKQSIIKYEAIENGEENNGRRDPTDPYWAVWSTPSFAFKHPSPMMVFSLGQSEQYGYYKRVTNWSTTFDGDLAAEIANPERLAIGTLDFNFVLLYLTPILMIILLFNVGGYEKDLKFDNLIYLGDIRKHQWLALRFLFYFILIFVSVFLCMVFYASIAGVLQHESQNLLSLILTIVLYILLWFIILYLIANWSNGSSDSSIKMISCWLTLCILIPGAVHQLASFKYPTNYMTDFLDVDREQTDAIFELSPDTMKLRMLEAYPFLEETMFATDTVMDENIINRGVSGLVNDLNVKVAKSVEKSNEQKNVFIQGFNLLNPVVYFQNKINFLTGTDYYAYASYREHIQSIINKKIKIILKDTWNRVIVDKEIYKGYVKNFD
tara:strand:+ start:354 stop:1670 length:1317 start_codon:yes stop_codon:yes gene_type:complete